MQNRYKFECGLCGLEFGSDVIKLALHMGKIHDPPRKNTDNR